MRSLYLIGILFCMGNSSAESTFTKGPLLKDFGANTRVIQTSPVAESEMFKVVFDVAEQSDPEKLNRKFNSLARFLNMHVRAGVAPENIQLALVVHGEAGFGLLKDVDYQNKYQLDNPNKGLLAELFKHKVRVIICGQSAAYLGIKNEQLMDGVEVALSAMTANALLQQDGYTLNPF